METQDHVLRAQRIALIISPHATPSITHTAHVLACGLTRLGKEVRVSSDPPHTPPRPNTCTVILRGLASRVAQISYEKDDEDVKLHFVLQRGNLSAKHISFDIVPRNDLTLILGDTHSEHNTHHTQTIILEALLNSPDAEQRFLGIVLFKIHPIQSSLYRIVISFEESTASQVEPKHIGSIVRVLQDHFGQQASFIFCLEQHNHQLQYIVWTPNQILRETLQKRLSFQIKGNWALATITPRQEEQLHRELMH